MQILSLFELHTFLRQVVALNFPEALWVRCELAQVSQSRGHVYLELVEKAEDGTDPSAQASAVIWQNMLRRLQARLGTSQLNGLLQTGTEVLLRVKVEFHERYGLKCVVEDIDPNYTLGKLEQRRRQLYEQLQQQGMLGKNRQVPLPPVLQRIAVISSENAAGYQDFQQHLAANPYNYHFQLQFFPAAMQGNQVEVEVMKQLRNIQRQTKRFDAVVIIRGGGAKLDLAGFDNLSLCEKIATFPLPVLTGIGHEVDETLVDLVAHTTLKTPTAVADFLLQHNVYFESNLLEMSQLFRYVSAELLHRAAFQMVGIVQNLQATPKLLLTRQSDKLQQINAELPLLAHYQQKEQWQKLEQLDQLCHLLSIEGTLQRGFALVRQSGKSIDSVHSLKKQDLIEVQLKDGEIQSRMMA